MKIDMRRQVDDENREIFPEEPLRMEYEGECYFAAANGYTGFRSGFAEVFRSEDHERIYVLKGGPGTGKSTLLKKCAAFGEEKGIRTIRIHCSSDPDSLDGVIFFPEKAKPIALLDGTAPHERDAVIPGAIDRLIDLGAYRADGVLAGHREEILRINAEKGLEYRRAYDALKLCGLFAGKIREYADEVFDREGAAAAIDAVLPKRPSSVGRDRAPGGLLIGCFGKKGYCRLTTLEKENAVIGVRGDAGLDGRMMEEIRKTLSDRGFFFRAFPSPLDPSRTEAILLPEEKLLFLTGAEGDESLTAEAKAGKRGALNEEEVRLLLREQKIFLDLARKHFAKASDLHFELEKLYTGSMDFSAIDRATGDILRDLSELFCL